MSEVKLYAVKNDEGEWLDQDHIFGPGAWAHPNKDQSEVKAKVYGGHVVALVEEPKKVVLSENQAEIVERAHNYDNPAGCISGDPSEELLMEAFVNGYTVAKEKKYLVYKELGGKQKNKQVAQAYRSVAVPGTMLWLLNIEVKNESRAKFSQEEIEQYGLQDCEKEEVTDDGVC